MALATNVPAAAADVNFPGVAPLFHRERVWAAALAGASGTVHLILEGGATLTGMLDVSHVGNLTGGTNPPQGGIVLVTDGSSVVWTVPLERIVSVGT